MLGMVFLIVSGALGGFRPAWRYMMGILIRHIAALAALGIVVAAIFGWWVN